MECSTDSMMSVTPTLNRFTDKPRTPREMSTVVAAYGGRIEPPQLMSDGSTHTVIFATAKRHISSSALGFFSRGENVSALGDSGSVTGATAGDGISAAQVSPLRVAPCYQPSSATDPPPSDSFVNPKEYRSAFSKSRGSMLHTDFLSLCRFTGSSLSLYCTSWWCAGRLFLYRKKLSMGHYHLAWSSHGKSRPDLITLTISTEI
jgi:hypothetical protein